MGSRVTHAVFLDVADIECGLAHFELQDNHAGNAMIQAQFIDLGRDHPKVLGDDGKIAQRLVHGFEHGISRPGHPLTLARGRCAVRY